ncbi:hypothetical protein F4680DRAFT_419062 [Xylaria scruposa]|nr:hypothetical protein F4680DRAFT_419062 [Xylaria scruposa]
MMTKHSILGRQAPGIMPGFSTPPPVTSILSEPTSYEYPPLTTLFTPDPSCSSFYLAGCSSSGGHDSPPQNCVAIAFPQAICLDGASLTATRSSLSCYPRSSGGFGLLTYSPGYFCPVGMTTVESVSVPNGAWCCLNGFTLTSSLCRKTTSEATVLSTNISNCTSEELKTISGELNGNDAVVLFASPILLTGQKFSITSATSSTATAPTSSAMTPASSTPDNNYNTIGLRVGLSIGLLLGTIFLLLLAFFCVRRHRKAKAAAAKSALSKQEARVEPDKYIGKPELEGSQAYVYTTKPELDAEAVRAELEGNVSEPHGDGINVLKPELEGTAGSERNKGAYVRNKPELEAMSKPYASATQHSLAELEVVASGSGPV